MSDEMMGCGVAEDEIERCVLNRNRVSSRQASALSTETPKNLLPLAHKEATACSLMSDRVTRDSGNVCLTRQEAQP